MEAMGSLQAHAPAMATQSCATPGKFSTSWAAELRTSPTLGSAAQTFLTQQIPGLSFLELGRSNFA